MGVDSPCCTVLCQARTTAPIRTGSLLVSEGYLYGMAGSAGSACQGTVFRMDTNGTDFQVLHRFAGSEGKWPYGDLIECGSMLYGITTYGGNNTNSGYVGGGTVFRVSKDGADFQVLHTFAGAPGDAANPYCALTQSGPVLFGTGNRGGNNNLGAVFKVNTNGADFQLLHSFQGAADGAYPCFGKLTQSGAVLHGTTAWGGSGAGGTAYKLNTNGTFQVLHHFGGGANDGSSLTGGLLPSGSLLYGMTSGGGTGDNGVVYRMDTNGSAFQILHSFGSGTSDGQGPAGDLILSGSTLYGMTIRGGSNNLGLIFAYNLPRPTLAISKSGTNLSISWSTNCPDFTLESTGQLTNAWTPVAGVTGYSATLPISTVTNQFFRLKK